MRRSTLFIDHTGLKKLKRSGLLQKLKILIKLNPNVRVKVLKDLIQERNIVNVEKWRWYKTNKIALKVLIKSMMSVSE